jgi:hypothetical protein
MFLMSDIKLRRDVAWFEAGPVAGENMRQFDTSAGDTI